MLKLLRCNALLNRSNAATGLCRKTWVEVPPLITCQSCARVFLHLDLGLFPPILTPCTFEPASWVVFDTMQSLCSSLSSLSLGQRTRSPRTPFCGHSLPGRQSRGTLVIVAAQNSKKREKTNERDRLYNKAHKSAVATRSKKVLKALAEFSGVESEDELAPVQKLMNEAYKEIDKAIAKGILHRNTGARRKAKLAHARQQLLIANGLYTPQPAQ